MQIKVPFLDLRSHHTPLLEEINGAIQEVIDSAAFAGGPFVTRFEEDFAVTNEGLRRYKLGWGTRESTVHYHRFDFGKNRFVGERDQANGLHNRIFRLMPIPALRLCGRMVYRHIA